MRGTPLNPRTTYGRCIARYEHHFNKPAVQLGRTEVRQFLLYLIEHEKLSPSSHNVYAAALHVLYARVLGRPRVVDELPRCKGVQRLPAVLTPSEVEGLLSALPPLHRAVLMVAYGAGLRVREVCGLHVRDVDSKAGVLYVRGTKRNRDRDAILSPRLLEELRSYCMGALSPGSPSDKLRKAKFEARSAWSRSSVSRIPARWTNTAISFATR